MGWARVEAVGLGARVKTRSKKRVAGFLLLTVKTKPRRTAKVSRKLGTRKRRRLRRHVGGNGLLPLLRTPETDSSVESYGLQAFEAPSEIFLFRLSSRKQNLG